MRHTITSILIILSVMYCGAQTASQRLWDDGPLRWEDFQAIPAMRQSPTFMAAEIVQNSHTTTINGMQTFSITASAVMYPARSYADSASRTDQQLRYYQAQFDLLEVMRRRYQNELARGINGIEADHRLTFYNNLYRTESERIKEMTSSGTDDKSLQFVEYDLRRQLDDIGEPQIPKVVPSQFKYGLMVGTGALWSTGSLHDSFSGSWNFTCGLLASWRRLNLEADITFGNPTINNPLLVNPQFADLPYRANVKTANFLAMGVKLGFSVIDRKKFSVSPWVGGYWTGYDWTAKQMEEGIDGTFDTTGLQEKMEVDDFNIAMGINFEWHFHSVVTHFPIFGSLREEYISSLRLTPYAIRGAYTDATCSFSGWLVGFTLSYSGMARALGIE